MSQYEKRKIAIKVADSINSIEGAPVSENAKKLNIPPKLNTLTVLN